MPSCLGAEKDSELRLSLSVSTRDSAMRTPQSASGHVTVEVVAWVTRFVGGDGTRRHVFQEPVAPGASVRNVLGQVSDRHPALRETLWDAGGLGLSEHIEVLVNDAVLGLTHTLDSPVRDGDRITLVGQYTGGMGGL
jgi:molybdopterin converting factor small subunit